MKKKVVTIGGVLLVMGWAAVATGFDGSPFDGSYYEKVDQLERLGDEVELERAQIDRDAEHLEDLLEGSFTDARTAHRATEGMRREVVAQVARWDGAGRQAERVALSEGRGESQRFVRALAASHLPVTDGWLRKVELISDVDAGLNRASGLLVERAKIDIRRAYLGGLGELAEAQRRWVIAQAGNEVREPGLKAELERMARRLEAHIEELAENPTDRDFHRRKGGLAPPVPQKPDHPFGPRQRDESYTEVRHTGLTYFVEAGTEIRSVGAGLVVAARRFPGYGKTVILDHGSDYHSLYAHLESFDVEVGEEIVNRQILGKSGESGSLEGPKLYFEMRFRGVPFDPEEWLVD